jgi:hypothetical protein
MVTSLVELGFPQTPTTTLHLLRSTLQLHQIKRAPRFLCNYYTLTNALPNGLHIKLKHIT